MSQASLNHCTLQGGCLCPTDDCAHYRLSVFTGICSYVEWNAMRCLSPYALMEARGIALPQPPAQQNYCSPTGVCTCSDFAQESSCTYYIQGATNGICQRRAWCDVCCSIEALKAAKAAAHVAA